MIIDLIYHGKKLGYGTTYKVLTSYHHKTGHYDGTSCEGSWMPLTHKDKATTNVEWETVLLMTKMQLNNIIFYVHVKCTVIFKV